MNKTDNEIKMRALAESIEYFFPNTPFFLSVEGIKGIMCISNVTDEYIPEFIQETLDNVKNNQPTKVNKCSSNKGEVST